MIGVIVYIGVIAFIVGVFYKRIKEVFSDDAAGTGDGPIFLWLFGLAFWPISIVVGAAFILGKKARKRWLEK